jgi:Zn-dependent peptidase ImmA (M78 family)
MDGIPNMSDVLEDHGIFVITTDVDDRDEFDGLTAWVNERPVIIVGSQWPGDRQRFTLAHELGHLIIGEHLADGLDKEKACHRFAGAFLVPKNTMIAELGAFRNRIEPRELYQLKREYGLSMYALIFRAKDTGVITEVTADILMRTFSSNGWRKMEPWESIPSERPHLFEQLVMHALAEDMVSTSKAAELMSLPLNDFRSRLAPESHNVAAHQ